MEEFTVREWIENFKSGKYDDSSFEIQCEAGWHDWFCPDKELADRLKKMGNVIQNIKEDFILDNFTLAFYNNCPVDYPVYDQAVFIPVEGVNEDFEFGISFEYPVSKYTYEIYTARNNREDEFHCMEDKELFKVLQQIAEEFQNQDSKKENVIKKKFFKSFCDILCSGKKSEK